MKAARFRNKFCVMEIGGDASLRCFTDISSGINYAADTGRSFAQIRARGSEARASSAEIQGNRVILNFGDSGAQAAFVVHDKGAYFVLEVERVEGAGAEEFTFMDCDLSLSGSPEEAFSACALGLNLQVRSGVMPGRSGKLEASCTREFGFKGAKAAIIGCPGGKLPEVLKTVIRDSGDMPYSELGGPWAGAAEINRGSYVFDFGDITEKTVDDWIETVKSIGFNQVNFHGGLGSIRFGDYEPGRHLYPEGAESLKKVIDRLHRSGIAAGLHTYSAMVEKESRWVTPVPHPDLAKNAVFTLSSDITADSDFIPVEESTEGMLTVTGRTQNSLTLQAGDELIVYSGLDRKPPYAFTGCIRGAHGTAAAEHGAGTRVFQLKERYNRFIPEYGTGLFKTVAGRIAGLYNSCGFDMIYFDALEAIGGLLGPGWHHEAEFVAEVQKRLERPAVMEMSAFHHHLWRYRSRYEAWDHPVRGYKRFIDRHLLSNRRAEKMLLPGVLGWWALQSWAGPPLEPTYPDDIEYLCLKALGTGSSHSMLRMKPGVYAGRPGFERLAEIFRKYEELRLSGSVSPEIKKELAVPGKEFMLESSSDSGPVFREYEQSKHKVECLESWSSAWKVENSFGEQPLRLRLESLVCAEPYDSPSSREILSAGSFPAGTRPFAARGVECGLERGEIESPCGAESFVLTARNENAPPGRAFALIKEVFDSLLNMAGIADGVKDQAHAHMEEIKQPAGMGLWVHGDGGGQVVNLRLRSPDWVISGFADHYITIDFKGWRYFELIEPEDERVLDFWWPDESRAGEWPRGDAAEERLSRFGYEVFRNSMDFTRIESLGIWFHNLPPGRTVKCAFSPVRAVRLVGGEIREPSLQVAGRRIVFPAALASGQYLEFEGDGDAVLYGRDGGRISGITPAGDAPRLSSGSNGVAFSCGNKSGLRPRARVVVNVAGGAAGGISAPGSAAG